MTTTVLVADDQAMVRRGFRLILDAEPGLRVVAEAADGAEAVRLAREHRPDVVLMDIRMPVVDGLRATRLLAGSDLPEPPRVVVVTSYDMDENVHAALRAGACGFLLKDAGPALLVEAVRAAALGDALISPSVTTRLLARFADRGEDREPRPPLTRRESEVARAVARGRTNAEIAGDLVISLPTVKSHLMAVQRKLGVRNRTEVAIWAWRTGLVR
ncbi:response regulator [Allonocardiopsis opalescens]|uniref:LuxR family two component transcriptional regulator n=1 Tax=Allonocardiopsis opalescens TaxID=1144618 RepID=A0A2T0Q4D2_9ACTN|nr:response regulator transcription factor [Allonocardiopsis opalescens]PRX98678.1 LuxR family two component transcriptional regulator [Allonocardiopsis opalescens]